MNIFSAVFVGYLLSKKIWGKIIGVVLIFFLTLSGLISFMVVKNDVKAAIPDYAKNSFLSWSYKHLPENQTIFTNGEIYDPILFIGKKTFIGRTQYIYTYGGDINPRLVIRQRLLQGKNKQDMMNIVEENNLHYFVFYKNNFAKNEEPFNQYFFDTNFTKLYEDNNAVVYRK